MKRIIFTTLIIIVTISSVLTSIGVFINSYYFVSELVEREKNGVFSQITQKMILFNNITYLMQKQTIEKGSESIINIHDYLYERNRSFNFTPEELKAAAVRYSFDEVYIINRSGIVEKTSFSPDKNLDLTNFGDKFSDFLKSVYGKGEVFTQRITQSTQTGKTNIYQYYSPLNSDYIFETSIGFGENILNTFGIDFVNDIVNNIFDKTNLSKNFLLDFDIFQGVEPNYRSILSDSPVSIIHVEDRSRLDTVLSESNNEVLFKRGSTFTFVKLMKFESGPNLISENLYCVVVYDFNSIFMFTYKIFGTIFILNICVIVLLLLIGFRIFDKLLIKRVDLINNAIDRIENGDYSVEFKDFHNDELSKIGKNIESMARSIYDQRTQLVSVKNHLDLIINAMPSMIITTDSDFSIKDYNSATVKRYGFNHKQLKNKSIFELIKELSENREDIVQRIGGQTADYIVYHKKNIYIKQELIFEVLVYGYKDNGNSYFVFVLDDITLYEKNNENINRVQQMELVGTLAAGFSHDFNNALTGIMGLVELIKVDYGIKDDKNGYIETLRDLIIHAKGTVSQLYAITKTSENKKEIVDIRSAIEFAYNVGKCFIPKSIKLSISKPDNPVLIEADISKLQQVILNLMINSSHAMTIMRQKDDSYTADNNKLDIILEESPNDTVTIKVTDTGVGISKTQISNIFEPFYTTKQDMGGTGLGLVMVKNIVNDHNGTIDVTSRVGEWTDFKLVFPKYIINQNEET